MQQILLAITQPAADPNAADPTSNNPTSADNSGHPTSTDTTAKDMVNSLFGSDNSIINPSNILSKLGGSNTGADSLSGTGFPR